MCLFLSLLVTHRGPEGWIGWHPALRLLENVGPPKPHALKTCHRHVFLTSFRIPDKHKKRKKHVPLPLAFGDPSGIRTPDTLIKSQVLCQLS